MREIGQEEYIRLLLENLKGNYAAGDEASNGAAFGYRPARE